MLTGILDTLSAYLAGRKSMTDCAEWLAGIDWDDPSFDADSRRLIGRLELLSTEIGEGLRSELEFRYEASRIITAYTEYVYFQVSPQLPLSLVASAANSRTEAYGFIRVSEEVGQGSLSWNISPRQVPA